MEPLPVAHAYNPRLRRQRSGGLQFEASPGEQFKRPYLKKHHKKETKVERRKIEMNQLGV
jgi:hypothetical protein